MVMSLKDLCVGLIILKLMINSSSLNKENNDIFTLGLVEIQRIY